MSDTTFLERNPVWDLLYRRLRIPLILLATVFVIGTMGYYVLGEFAPAGAKPHGPWTLLDCAFMTAITLTTIGYGDVLLVHESGFVAGQIYTMLLAFMGMGTALYAVSEATSFFVEGHIGKLREEYRRMKEIDSLEGHIIVCGLGDTGSQIAEEILHTGATVCAIEIDPHRVERAREAHPELPVLEGDATEEETLEKAGIKRARGLAAALHTDKDNLFLVVTARQLAPSLKIVAKAEASSTGKKLQIAGANSVVSPPRIGGMRIASALVRPHVVTFLDRMISHGAGHRMEEIIVEEGSDLAGKSLAEAHIFERTGLIAMAVRMPDGEYVYNPAGGTQVESGSILVVIGTPDQVFKLRSFAS
ncbi:MAG: potassium channel family protein [Planctomycetota bacterium]